jgi:hypothetical protein
VLGAALYGAALGSWHGPRLALYASIKLPLVLIATSLLTAGLQVLVGRIGGLRRGALATIGLSIAALARAARLLGALSPIAAFMTWSTPAPGEEARTAHNELFLAHTVLVAACGTVGVLGLARELGGAMPTHLAARRVLALWVASFALVGGEVAWALRPFVGSVYEPVAFLRSDALDGNVYEFLVLDALPHLLHLDAKGASP